MTHSNAELTQTLSTETLQPSGLVQRLKSPGRDERFSIVKTSSFAARVHCFVRHLLALLNGLVRPATYLKQVENTTAATATLIVSHRGIGLPLPSLHHFSRFTKPIALQRSVLTVNPLTRLFAVRVKRTKQDGSRVALRLNPSASTGCSEPYSSLAP